MGYPGAAAIVPTFASALLIIGLSKSSHLAAILSAKLMTAIGDRSYSLYLWHWPVLAIAIERWPESSITKILALPVFVAIAYVSYAKIEKPIHESEAFSTLRIPIAVASISAVCVFAFLLAALPTPPTADRRAEAIKRASSDFSRLYTDHCHLNFNETRSPPCIYGKADSNRTVVLFGDSHAAQWFDALDKAATETGWRLIARTKSSCPSNDAGMWLAPMKHFYEACDEWRRNVLDELRAIHPELVILANSSHYNNFLYERSTKTRISQTRSPEVWRGNTLTMIGKLSDIGLPVVIIRDNPRMLDSYRSCLSYSDACGRTRDSALAGMDLSKEDIIANVGATQLDVNDRICSASWCPAMINGSIIYQDNHHLTASFAETFWPDFLNLLKHYSEESDRPSPQTGAQRY